MLLLMLLTLRVDDADEQTVTNIIVSMSRLSYWEEVSWWMWWRMLRRMLRRSESDEERVCHDVRCLLIRSSRNTIIVVYMKDNPGWSLAVLAVTGPLGNSLLDLCTTRTDKSIVLWLVALRWAAHLLRYP